MPVKISVIIPTRNAVAYLLECLASVQKQIVAAHNVSFDILIGIDAHEETAMFFKDNFGQLVNARVFYFKNQLGPYIIRNTLAAITDADYLVFFDSDDIMPEGFINSLLAPFKNYSLIRFGFKNFIDLQSKAGTTQRVFDKKKIARFEKHVVQKQTIAAEGRPSLIKRLHTLPASKYLKIGRYGNFLATLFKRQRSGVIAIKKSAFMQLKGFKPWPVEADLELIARAQLHKISQTTLPRSVDFLRRIHLNNLTSNYKVGMQSQTRKHYQELRKKSIFENIDMVTALSYVEIL